MDMNEGTLDFLKHNLLRVVNSNGTTFLDKSMLPYYEDNLSKERIHTSSLNAVISYVCSNFDDRSKIIIQVVSPTKVEVLGRMDKHGRREHLLTATPYDNSFDFNEFVDREQFNIALQSKFIENEDSQKVLKLIGNLVDSTRKTSVDDGVTQEATVRSGVASVENVEMPHIITLKPYRTFTEVDQPSSEFVFRIGQDMQCALFEADGGKWKEEATQNIRVYIKDNLKVKSDVLKKVVIL